MAIIETVGQAHEVLNRFFQDSRDMVAFTGAGISTESGIPDFRSKNSAWKRYPPIPFNEFLANEQVRIESWRRKFIMDDLYRGAQPNAGHHALAHLVHVERMGCVITQNIDGLHEASGIPREKIIELHGNGTYAGCLSCGERHELDEIRRYFESSGRAPECGCGGIVKTATIAFGQSMPEEQMKRARRAALACDLMLAIGSSLVVYPAAGFPALARENGAKLIIINREPTALDEIADAVIRCDIGVTLAPFADRRRTN
ncbi:MAG: NAD-dependent deacetylase [Alphaproteobacteria bacterium]|nr:NAD-dependent deacetylase [Alphaproteobacteria bacterium]